MLGPLEVTDGSRPLALGGAKQRAVLAALLLRAGKVVPVERLAGDVWGDAPPSSAEHTLAAYVSRLRAALSPYGVTLERRGTGFRVVVDEATLDVRQFTRLSEQAATASAAGDHGRAAEAWRQALALWHGDALADVALYEGGRVEVERLEELRLHAIEQRVDADLALGRHDQVASELRALAEVHPYRERFVAQLMTALYRAGRQAEALDAYEALRGRLDAELGLQPSRELQHLSGRIVRQEAELAPPARPSPPPPDARTPEPRHRGAGRRRAPAAALAGAIVAVVAIPILALGRGGGDEGALPASAGNALAILDPGSGRLLADVAVGTAPGDVAASDGAVWVAHEGDGTVYRVDAATRTVRQTIHAGSSAGGIAAGEGYVWVADGLEGTLSRIDPRSNEITERILVGNGPAGVTVGAGFVWVVTRDDPALVQIAPESGRIVGRLHVGSDPVDVAVADGAVWVTSESEGTVRKLDAQSGRTLDAVTVGRGPGRVAVGAGAVWVANTIDGTVSRVDPETSAVTATIEVGGSPSGIAVLEDVVWVTAELDGAVVRIDPATNAVTRATVGGRPAGLAVSPAGILVAVRPGGTPHAGGTLTAALEVTSIDTFGGESWELLGLTNDGLTAFRRVGGQAGARIVANLATSLPRPLDAGRTYVFTLRRGVRYSTGRPVRPRDVRASLERLFELQSGSAFLYRAIVGAHACLERPRPCDLSRGIVADDRTSSVTFRLTAPDPDLPAKLALPYAFVVPAGTPSRAIGTHALPATGPYAIASFVPGRRLRLVRNPAFRKELRPLRPAGYPDEIVVRLDVPLARRASAVARDMIDVAGLTGADLTSIRKRYGSRLHSNPSQAVLYVFLDTSAPPFDDVRVRAALNHVVDRARAVREFGGVERAAATCQVLPPNFPGYRPYCPWKLDRAAARRLVAGSGRRGGEVVVWASASSRAWIRPVVSALRDLGFRARLRSIPDAEYFDAVQRDGARARAGFYGWVPNYVSPADAIVPFTCREARDGGSNLSRFCDREVERLAARARALRTSDQAGANRLWKRVDRAITDRAPVVPLLNPHTADFVSTRVGNYQFNPVWGVLLEQLWVQ